MIRLVILLRLVIYLLIIHELYIILSIHRSIRLIIHLFIRICHDDKKCNYDRQNTMYCII